MKEQDIEDTPRLHGYPHEQPQQYGLSVLLNEGTNLKNKDI